MGNNTPSVTAYAKYLIHKGEKKRQRLCKIESKHSVKKKVMDPALSKGRRKKGLDFCFWPNGGMKPTIKELPVSNSMLDREIKTPIKPVY